MYTENKLYTCIKIIYTENKPYACIKILLTCTKTAYTYICTQKRAEKFHLLFGSVSFNFGRDERIRTSDPLHPMQMR